MSGVVGELPPSAELPYSPAGSLDGVEYVKPPAITQLGDVATAGTSAAVTETIDGQFYGVVERWADDLAKSVPLVGPGIARGLRRAVRRALKATKAPASSQQGQSQAHTARLLHYLAVLVDATAFHLGSMAEEIYDTFSLLRHVVMPQYVESQVAPVRRTARLAKAEADQLIRDANAETAAVNTLARSLPWNFHAATFPAAVRVWVGLFSRLWHKAFTNLERRLAHLENVRVPTIERRLTALNDFVHGAVVPDIRKLQSQMSDVLVKLVPDLRRGIAKINTYIHDTLEPELRRIRAKDTQQDTTLKKQGVELAALAPLLTAAGFGQAFGNAAANDPQAGTDICDPVTECAGSNVLGKGGWSWLKKYLPGLLNDALDVLLLTDICAFVDVASSAADLVQPIAESLVNVENALCLGGGSSPHGPFPPVAY